MARGKPEAALGWRVLAGVGAVGLNVMLTKMAADRFQDRSDLPTAMGVLVSSWPAGIALATLVLPPVAAGPGVGLALVLPAVLSAFAGVLLAVVWRTPGHHAAFRLPQEVPSLSPSELMLVVIAGIIWGLYNASLIAAIAFTPGVLVTRGIDGMTAAAAVSLIGWAAIFPVAAGGLAGGAVAAPRPSGIRLFRAVGGDPDRDPGHRRRRGIGVGHAGVGSGDRSAGGRHHGAAGGSRPAGAARLEPGAMAMGVFLAVCDALMGLAPPALGALRDVTSDAAAPLPAATGALVACLCLWVAFRGAQRRVVTGQRIS